MWSKNIFKEGGRFEARIPAYFERFVVRKIPPFFAGQSGRVLPLVSLAFLTRFFVSRWSKNIFKEGVEKDLHRREDRGKDS